MTCSVPGCEARHHARGICRLHYNQTLRRTGKDGMPERVFFLPLERRLRAKTAPPDANGCRRWLGCKNAGGYGHIGVGLSSKKAHRVAWELEHGPIPKGMTIDHLCRVRDCVNVKHLRVVTQRENNLAPGSRTISARHAAKPVCPKCGGAYESERRRNGLVSRVCRPCQRAYKHPPRPIKPRIAEGLGK